MSENAEGENLFADFVSSQDPEPGDDDDDEKKKEKRGQACGPGVCQIKLVPW